MALVTTLKDSFNADSINSSKWSPVVPGSGRYAQANNRLALTSYTVANIYDGIYSVETYDLTGSSASVRVVDAGSQSIASLQTILRLYVDSNSGFIFWIGGGNIYAQKLVAGTYTSFYSQTYNSSVHKWLRIREAGGTTYWEYSTDGIKWQSFTSLANPFAVTSMHVSLGIGVYSTESTTTTAYFDNFNIPGTIGASNKRYVYKWYTGSTFNGVLQNVNSKFSLTEQINTAGSQIEIELGINFQDSNATQTTDLLIDESEDLITTEQLEGIIVGTNVSIEGFPGLNDRIETWEFSEDYPNGILMFDGLVSKWSSDYKKNTTKITVLSYGVQLDNYLVQIFPSAVLISNTVTDGTEILYSQWKDPLDRITSVGQTFAPGVTSDVTSVTLKLGNPGTMDVDCTVAIIQGTPTTPGSVMGSVTRAVPPQSDTDTLFSFSSPITLDASTTYHFYILNEAYGISETNTISVAKDTTGAYSGGTMYIYNDLTEWASNAYDLGFTLSTSSGGIGNQFLSTDPGQMVRDLVDNFISLGGALNYTNDSVALAGTTVSYTFKFNKYLEAIKKSVELAPADWWWRVDSATGVLYFQPLSQDVDHRFILGKHLENLTIESSLEDVTNVVYYSGGDDGTGTNILVNTNDATSIAQYGTWLTTVSDNRVTLESTATILSESLLNQYKDPRYMTTISIPSTVYDSNLISVGDIVGFGNFNNFVDSLQLQVMSKTYAPDMVTLKLDLLPPTVSKRIEDIKRNLDKQQTENNPNV